MQRLHGRPKVRPSRSSPPTRRTDLLVDAYKETDPNWHPASPADASLRGDWWTLFADPTLSTLEVKAAAQNQSLRSSIARYEQAQAQIGINRSALYPTIGTAPAVQGIRYSAGRPFFNSTNLNGADAGVPDLQLPLTLSYEFDFWGRIRRTVNIAKEEVQASSADLQTAQLSIQSELAMDYFELRSADAQEKLLADTVKDYQEALRITTTTALKVASSPSRTSSRLAPSCRPPSSSSLMSPCSARVMSTPSPSLSGSRPTVSRSRSRRSMRSPRSFRPACPRSC